MHIGSVPFGVRFFYLQNILYYFALTVDIVNNKYYICIIINNKAESEASRLQK